MVRLCRPLLCLGKCRASSGVTPSISSPAEMRLWFIVVLAWHLPSLADVTSQRRGRETWMLGDWTLRIPGFYFNADDFFYLYYLLENNRLKILLYMEKTEVARNGRDKTTKTERKGSKRRVLETPRVFACFVLGLLLFMRCAHHYHSLTKISCLAAERAWPRWGGGGSSSPHAGIT